MHLNHQLAGGNQLAIHESGRGFELGSSKTKSRWGKSGTWTRDRWTLDHAASSNITNLIFPQGDDFPVNVRRAVGEAIVAAQAVRSQRYMSYCIDSFSRGKSHPKLSYLRKNLWMDGFINIPFFNFNLSLEILFFNFNPNGIIFNVTRVSLIRLKIWWDNHNENILLRLANIYIFIYLFMSIIIVSGRW